MGGEINEECGIGGIYLKGDNPDLLLTPQLLYPLGFQLQHRGQLGCGIGVYNNINSHPGRRIKVLKTVGKVNDLFQTNDKSQNSRINLEYSGNSGIIHTRYATSGSKNLSLSELLLETQPFFREHSRVWKEFCLGFNGNIANAPELRRRLSDGNQHHFKTTTDTEAITNLFALKIKESVRANPDGTDKKPDLFEVGRKVMNELDGAYSILTLFSDGSMLALRDPLGIKPFVYGETPSYFAFASESVALRKIGITDFLNLKPGYGVLVENNTLIEQELIPSKNRSHCFFEWPYFAKVVSNLDGQSVYSTRKRLGGNFNTPESLLTKINEDPENFVVVAAPNTAIPAAEELAHKLGLRYQQALIKVEGERGFINSPEVRRMVMDREYCVIEEIISGKNVLLVDDSIVRGETSKRLVNLLRDVGRANSVYLYSTVPPLTCPCFYGIDMATFDELIANRVSPEDIGAGVAREIGADGVIYQSIDGLLAAYDIPKSDLCLACLNGEYPTHYGKLRADEARKSISDKVN